MNTARRLLPLLLPMLALAACGEEPRSFGTIRDQSSGTSVQTIPPLSVPPLFAERPARDDLSRPTDTTAADLSLAAGATPRGTTPRGATPQAASDAAALSPGQESLVADSGPPAPADIRQRVTSDEQLGAPSQALADEILSQPARGAGLIVRSSPGFWSSLF
jgi:hypothetical protein